MAMNNLEEYTRTFTSFSGADIVASFNGRVIGELQALSYSVAREVAPVYTMGSPDARSFSRGKRGISGSLVFVQFDRDALIEEMHKEYKGAPSIQKIQQYVTNMSGVGSKGATGLEDQILSGLKSTSANGANTYGINTWDEQMTKLGYGSTASSGFDDSNLVDFYTPEYADQLMPFNVTISMANEFGQRAGMELYGIQLLNEASGFSVDDVITAKAYTFVARKLKGIQAKDSLKQTGSSSAKVSSGQSFTL
ncbi:MULTISPECIES: hypothetical protein [Bacillus]|uniref:hypothetical protein n=1 Tax=Bacillus TaxID=1386 RepID=UPI0009B7B022|nr:MULTISPECIES: hypothetical protein [Bacillus]ARC67424.1 hypothetical protein B14_200213 [Bacillus licheniformis]ARW46167.1 hypothetical protein S100141_04949 [Bacillus licheniformis]MCY8577134.1 hypothetical protein [Bacillus haynesii]MDE1421854.1 hypothetical protein [Bacillus licheniformis]MEC0475859.1 hypothetical protein [Bacillus licheniformis]